MKPEMESFRVSPWHLLLFLILLVGVNAVRQAPVPVTSTRATLSTIATQPASSTKPTVDELAHNSAILKTLQEERLTILMPGLPTWVRDHLIAFEDSGEQGVAFARSVAWGEGEYKNQSFYWFAYSDGNGMLQMDLSVAIQKEDIDAINGVMQDNHEYVLTKSWRIGARSAESSFDIAGTATNIALNGNSVSWTNEFCVQPTSYICDAAGAFGKYFLPAANALPVQMSLVLKGRFPR